LKNWTPPHHAECEENQVDEEEWIDAGKGSVVLCTIFDGDLINGVMKPDAESKTLENVSLEGGIVTEEMSWAKNADTYSTFLKFANN
jgi:hypothetical protein